MTQAIRLSDSTVPCYKIYDQVTYSGQLYQSIRVLLFEFYSFSFLIAFQLIFYFIKNGTINKRFIQNTDLPPTNPCITSDLMCIPQKSHFLISELFLFTKLNVSNNSEIRMFWQHKNMKTSYLMLGKTEKPGVLCKQGCK